MKPPYHRLTEFVPLTSADVELVQQWLSPPQTVERGQTIRAEGQDVDGVFLLLHGWVASSVMLKSGHRQIVKVHITGDMLGLPSLATAKTAETLEAISDAAVCHISNTRLGAMFTEAPRIAAAILLSSQKERVALMHSLSWLGATEAKERFVAFLLDIYDRLDAAGLVTDGGFEFPLKQYHMAESIGVTAVHMNRILRRLDRTGFIIRGRDTFRIVDLKGLKQIAVNRIPVSAGRRAWHRLNVGEA